ncbi:cyclopropane-fatty-acyl-phospholipid synthase, partial [Lecanoromycetidae sp. Uapishka_2]
MAIVSHTFDFVRSYLGSFTWGPLVKLSRSAVLGLLRKVEIGQLVIEDIDGTKTICGRSGAMDGAPRTELKVLKEAFWVRLMLFADMGFAESFMLGEISCPDLVAFFRIFILNRAQLSNATTLTSSLASTVTGLARSTNTMTNSQLNVSAHYDISNAMFAAFLSEDMTYSCPIWQPLSDPKSQNESLESAQETKLQYFIDAAKLKSTDHVLEIGTGWGSFAIAAVKKTGCRITSLTLSREQKELADERIAAAGYTDNIEVLLCDYRALPTPKEGLYDKVVSIEMLEAVGREYLDTYFECVNRMLKPEGGIGVFQCITMPEGRYDGYAKGEDFIRKYIFPGGHLPTVSQLVGGIERGSEKTLVVDALLNIGGHYAKTLRLWREKFETKFDSEIRPALLDEHEGMKEKDVELFRRKWEYYFTYCEAGFNTKTLGDVIITVGREGATEMLENIPL